MNSATGRPAPSPGIYHRAPAQRDSQRRFMQIGPGLGVKYGSKDGRISVAPAVAQKQGQDSATQAREAGRT